MQQNKFGQLVFNEADLCDEIMQGRDVTEFQHVIVDCSLDLDRLMASLDDPGALLTWAVPDSADTEISQFHAQQQQQWHMPAAYRDTDIVAYVLDLCTTPEQLQRAGQELLMFQERNLLDLLRYLRYLVDVMRENQVIWGVGRGSSVASYVLYLLGVHRIDSMFYDLDPAEFLR
jgi:DNA polymerase III alpha subunit